MIKGTLWKGKTEILESYLTKRNQSVKAYVEKMIIRSCVSLGSLLGLLYTNNIWDIQYCSKLISIT